MQTLLAKLCQKYHPVQQSFPFKCEKSTSDEANKSFGYWVDKKQTNKQIKKNSPILRLSFSSHPARGLRLKPLKKHYNIFVSHQACSAVMTFQALNTASFEEALMLSSDSFSHPRRSDQPNASFYLKTDLSTKIRGKKLI